jgi:hypothetical protein
VRRLEDELALYLPAQSVSVETNGTVAIQLALRAVGGRRGTVITTPFTFAATTTALVWEGFTPKFVDVDIDTFNLAPELVSEHMDRDTVGVLSVHVFGNAAGAQDVAALAKEDSRWAIFDAAHAFGVRTNGRNLFDLGDASTLSFHATKNFHTFEGGAITTPSARIARRVRSLRNFGFSDSGDVPSPGINGKMSEAQAAMGLANLKHVDRWIRARGQRYKLYRDLLESSPSIRFQVVEAQRYNYCYMPILLPTRRARDRVCRALEAVRVYPRRYFFPLTSDLSFLRRGARARCPVASEVAGRVLALPLYPDLPTSQVRRIVACVRAVLGN